MKSVFTVSVIACLTAVGCRKADPVPGSTPAENINTNRVAALPPVTLTPILQIHWAGREKLAVDPGATNFLSICSMPESVRLQKQTLDKLASAPWRLLVDRSTNSNGVSNAATSETLLRPLLDDIVQRECHLEVFGTNNRTEWLLAVNLDDLHAKVWEKNIASAMQSLAKPASANHGGRAWQLPSADPNLIELVRVGDWTVLSANNERGEGHANLAGRLKASADRDAASNAWLSAEIDLPQMARVYGWNVKPSIDLPNVSLLVSGEGQFVRTRGELNFAHPLDLKLDDWKIPTNSIHTWLGSFAAARGIGPWLAAFDGLKHIGVENPPNQLISWGVRGLPPEIYVSAPMADPGPVVKRLSSWVLAEEERRSLTNELFGFAEAVEFEGILWRGLPFLCPFLRATNELGQNFVIGGLVYVRGDINPPPLDFFAGLYERTNVVFYDREFTTEQINQWTYIMQFIRYVSGKAQLDNNSAGIEWMKAVARRVGSSGTDITPTGPAQLTLTRNSGVGFTAPELNLLADWFESPDFPVGLHTFRAKPQKSNGVTTNAFEAKPTRSK